jgi:hypothetical protein
MLKEIPILFSTDMVKAILDGSKTMTRRIMKPQPTPDDIEKIKDWNDELFTRPKYIKGDLIWVRETYTKILGDCQCDSTCNCGIIWYKTKGPIDSMTKWTPSIFMPKAAARIWLEVTNIKVERLQSITEADAIKEGIKRLIPHYNGISTTAVYKNYISETSIRCKPLVSFQSLWEKINGPDSWNANPWIWVIEFKVLSTTGKPSNN